MVSCYHTIESVLLYYCDLQIFQIVENQKTIRKFRNRTKKAFSPIVRILPVEVRPDNGEVILLCSHPPVAHLNIQIGR